MLKTRIYLTKVIQYTGRIQGAIYKKPKLAQYIISSGFGDGFCSWDDPVNDQQICWAVSDEVVHDKIEDDPDIYALSPLFSTRQEYRNWLNTPIQESEKELLENMGFPILNFSNGTSWKYMLRFISLQHRLFQSFQGRREFDIIDFFKNGNNSEVKNVSVNARNRLISWMKKQDNDVSWISPTTKVKDILKHIVENLEDKPFRLGGEDLNV